jgi:hypothetical protein
VGIKKYPNVRKSPEVIIFTRIFVVSLFQITRHTCALQVAHGILQMRRGGIVGGKINHIDEPVIHDSVLFYLKFISKPSSKFNAVLSHN